MQIALLGDVMLGRLVNDQLKVAAPDYPWGDTLPVLRQADIRFANLECVLADDGTPAAGKMYHFRSDAKNVESLRSAAIDVVSLANNHVFDYGVDALLEMLATLDEHGILYAGAGIDLESARRPVVRWMGATAVGFIAFTDNEPGWEATARTPGIHYVPVDTGDGRVKELLDMVRRTKDYNQLLVVSAHWGANWGSTVPPAHQSLARALIDAGADVVFGHSAHIFRGIEIYRGRPIVYSAGDFVDDYAVDPDERNDQSFVFLLETEGNAPRMLCLHPTNIARLQTRLASRNAGRIAERMQRLSRQFGTRSTWIEGDKVLEIPIDPVS
ncbi:CapA family protein [Arthrobacter sp. AZCC_0090]|uniref:CapA family protein n=1 Tax=Arthrobacter sp. AZCC_0090 TaxID=2735881 RepID=UPI001610ADDC|nr:CapA family protein [Arthrobacter sp. AZCC_0090]MBB6402747.1 poly-gamma-glutamate synthesis protein (capsule biosynthesis protein) [Arthrobacter sp. AZCC_0090]